MLNVAENHIDILVCSLTRIFLQTISHRVRYIHRLWPVHNKLFTDSSMSRELTLWCPLLPYGYSYKASGTRPG